MPWMSVVCTCTFEAVSAYPAEILVDYVAGPRGTVLGSSMQRATAGTADVVLRFSRRCSRILLGCAVREIKPRQQGGKVRLSWTDAEGREFAEEFDEAVVATQANAALDTLGEHASADVRAGA
jgi:predicted NAD/FAD-binding protein